MGGEWQGRNNVYLLYRITVTREDITFPSHSVDISVNE